MREVSSNQRDGNTHCPLVNYDYVLSLFPADYEALNEARIYLDNERRNEPFFHQFTVGFERELMPTLSVSADYVNMRGRDLLNRINYIAPLRAGTNDSDPLTWHDVFGEIYDRTDTVLYPSTGMGPAGYNVGAFQNRVLSIQSVGQSSHDALNFALEKRYANRWGGRVSYALGHSRGNAFEQYGTNGPSPQRNPDPGSGRPQSGRELAGFGDGPAAHPIARRAHGALGRHHPERHIPLHDRAAVQRHRQHH